MAEENKQPVTPDPENLKKYSIMIGTPCYGGQCTSAYTQSITKLSAICAANGISLNTLFLNNESLIQRARNYIVDSFLRSDCTHLMFIDADIAFHPMYVLQLLQLQTQDPDNYDILVGPYPKKTVAWEKVEAAVNSGMVENPHHLPYFAGDFVMNLSSNASSFKIAEPVEIREGGTGFMLIPREAFLKFRVAYPEKSYLPDHHRTEHFDGSKEIHAYFDCIIDPETKRYLSEDYYFCQYSRAAGLKLHMCPWMNIDHVGTYIYRGNMGAVGSIGESLTVSKASNAKNFKKSNSKKPKKKRALNYR